MTAVIDDEPPGHMPGAVRHVNPDGTPGGWVAPSATVAPTAHVGRDARVSGAARVSGDARVSSSRCILTVGPLGSENRHITAYRTFAGGHQIVAGCWSGTCDELAARIAPDGGHGWPAAAAGRAREDYMAVLPLLRARAAEWAEVAS